MFISATPRLMKRPGKSFWKRPILVDLGRSGEVGGESDDPLVLGAELGQHLAVDLGLGHVVSVIDRPGQSLRHDVHSFPRDSSA
jgi:hypothetical protein